MKIINFLSIGLLALLLLTYGCKKDTPSDPVDGMENMQVPDGFTFNTSAEVDVSIQMPASLDFTDLRSRFDVYDKNPAEGGKLLTSGSFDSNGAYDGTLRLPTALNEVYVRTIAGDVLVSLQEDPALKEGGVIIDFGDEYGYFEPDSIPEDSIPSILNFLGNSKDIYPSLSSRSNAISNGDFETNDFGSIYHWNTTHPVDGKWYFTTYGYGSMERYNDGGNHVVRTPHASSYYYGGTSQMIDAGPGDVVTFSADIRKQGNGGSLYAYLYLIPRRANGSYIDFYSILYSNPASSWTNKQIVATMPSGTATVQVLIWTNDYRANGSIQYDNVVVTGPVTDSDGDGVDDELDDYPNDNSRAFNVYYPNETDWGTLAFEDLWPGTGDYDFNDLVLDYQYKSVLNSNNGLVEFFTDYSVRAVGASLQNAFGFIVGGDPANVASVTGTNITDNYLDLAANGTENGQANTVIFLFDNAFDMIGSSGSAFINTKPDIEYVDPDTNTVHVSFVNPQSTTITGSAPYNPFLVIDRVRGQEVHLAGQEPSDLMDVALFGTWADDSNPASGKYYQTSNNLPWALDIPVSFDYPVEQVQIINAYNHFVEWAETAGVSYPDWYTNASGYRNASNIYSPPN